MAEDKGHKPSKRRLEKARSEGKTLKSSILTQSISLVSLLAAARILAPQAWVANRMLLEYCWSEGLMYPEKCAVGMGQILLETVLPSLIFAALVSIIAEGFQIGFRFNAALASPRGSVLEIGSGFKRLASGFRNSWQLLLRLAVLSLVVFWFFSDIVGAAAGWSTASWSGRPAYAGSFLLELLALGGVLSVFLGLIDYGLKRRAYYRELSMSFAELRQEHKEEEGDPQMRSARREMHHALSLGELTARVRKSKCIVVEKSA